MHEVVIDKTRIELHEQIDSAAHIASLLDDESERGVLLARLSNGVCRSEVRFFSRPKTQSYYLGGNLTLDNYSGHSGALLQIEREFHRLKGTIFQQTQKGLEAKGLACHVDGSGLRLPGVASLTGSGTFNLYICNEYKWPDATRAGNGIDLLCYEVALCAVCVALFYDMANRVVMDNQTIAGDVMFDKFGSYLKLDVEEARARHKDEALSVDLRRTLEEAIRMMQEADAVVLRQKGQ